MDTSLAHENARLRALLQTQQDTIRQMAEYNRLLSLRVAAYATDTGSTGANQRTSGRNGGNAG
ncbi:Mobile element protein [Escherichia coli]|uniref:Mobile element protein n=1 Tax=Escherichia coli TaxID=562 RepID=A0A1W1EMG1_ECOLX|nr:Mobile element protein [Escherichia coli]